MLPILAALDVVDCGGRGDPVVAAFVVVRITVCGHTVCCFYEGQGGDDSCGE